MDTLVEKVDQVASPGKENSVTRLVSSRHFLSADCTKKAEGPHYKKGSSALCSDMDCS